MRSLLLPAFSRAFFRGMADSGDDLECMFLHYWKDWAWLNWYTIPKKPNEGKISRFLVNEPSHLDTVVYYDWISERPIGR
jgi:hypothetical protein